jgi:RecJ-like exonuclease
MESNNGSKPAETVECKYCDGHGWISVGHQQEQCPYCYATGEEPTVEDHEKPSFKEPTVNNEITK